MLTHRLSISSAIAAARASGLVHRVAWTEESSVLLEQLHVARSLAELGFGVVPCDGSATPYVAAHLPTRPGFGTRRLPLTWGRAGGVVEVRDTRSGDLRVHTLVELEEVREAEEILGGGVLTRWSSPTVDALVEAGAVFAHGDDIVGLPVRRFRALWQPTMVSLLPDGTGDASASRRSERIPVRVTLSTSP
jgi:Family of unknown function (DUF5825)